MTWVVMQSDEFGCERFPRETMEEAIETIQNLVKCTSELDDGIERVIGIIVNDQTAEHDPLGVVGILTENDQ